MGTALQGIIIRKDTIRHGLIKSLPSTAEEIEVIGTTVKDSCKHMWWH